MLVKQYEAMRRGDYGATARQFYTGNASVARHHLLDAGGFDTSFRRAEDVELAYRLDDRGLRFRFDRDAVVLHYAERSFDAWRRPPPYGHNDVIFARDLGQRWLLDSIAPEFSGRNTLVRALTKACAPATAPRPGDRRRRSPPRGPPLASARSPRPALSAIYNLDYYRGMAEELGIRRDLLALFDARQRRTTGQPRVGFVLEQTLGHITHADNLQHLVGADHSIDAVFAPVAFDVAAGGPRARLRQLDGPRRRAGPPGDPPAAPGRAARRAVRPHPGAGHPVARHVARIPTVVSLDATPLQYDELGALYGHDTGSRAVEQLKWRANRACFAARRHRRVGRVDEAGPRRPLRGRRPTRST